MTPSLKFQRLCLWLQGGILVLLPGLSHAFDPLATSLSYLDPPPVYWDNLEGNRYWLDGPLPIFDTETGMHWLTLRDPEPVAIFLPAGATLRLHGPRLEDRWHALEVAASNGSGLRRHLAPTPSSAPDSRLVLAEMGHDRVLYLRRADATDKPLRLALFISRTASRGDLLQYRDHIPLEGTPHTLHRESESTGAPVWPVTPQGPMAFDLQGPGRFELQSTLRYVDDDHTMLSPYRLTMNIDDQPALHLDHTARFDGRAANRLDGCVTPLARTYSDYLDLPPGPHRVTLSSDQAVVVKLSRLQEPDFLLPINDPARTMIAQNAANAESTADDPDVPFQSLRPDARVKLARSVAIDNRYRDGGLIATQILDRTLAEYPWLPGLRELATEMRGLHTAWQPLFPEGDARGSEQRFAWFLRRPLQSIDQPRGDQLVARQHIPSAAGRLGSGYFHPLARSPKEGLDYRLPEQAADTWLQLSVDRSGVRAPTRLYLQVDDAPPIAFTVSQQPDLTPDAYAFTTAGTALAALQAWPGQEVTLDGAFAFHHQSAPLIPAADAEIPLPQGAHRVRVWSAEVADMSPSIALNVRQSRDYRLSEAQYLATLNAVPADRRQALFIAHAKNLQSVLESSDELPEQAALSGQWLATLRMLNQRYASYTAQVLPPGDAQDSTLSLRQQDRLLREARRAQATDWVEPLTRWQALAKAGDAHTRNIARLAQAYILMTNGESFLAERMLRGLLLFSQDTEIRAAAQQRLAAHYAATGDEYNALNLRVADWFANADDETLRRLVKGLAEQGHATAAVQLAVMLADSKEIADAIAMSAYQAGWWQTFTQSVDLIDNAERRAYWLGYRALQRGDIPAARDQWRQAGLAGRALLDALDDGQRIRDELRHAEPSRRAEAIRAWERWQARLPGPHQWQFGTLTPVRTAGAGSYHSDARDLTTLAFATTLEQPAEFDIHGPLRLRVEARLLHDKADTSPLDGWIDAQYDEQHLVTPIIDSLPRPELALVGEVDQQVGNLQVMEFELPAGRHRVRLGTGTRPGVVRLAAWRPVLPLPTLPMLTPDTLRAMSSPARETAPLAREQEGNCHFNGCSYIIDSCKLSAVADSEPVSHNTLATPAGWHQATQRALDKLPASVPSEGTTGTAVILSPLPDTLNELLRRQGAALHADGTLDLADSTQDLGPNPRAGRLLGALWWWADHKPADQQKIVTLAASLVQRHPQLDAHPLAFRLSNLSRWELISNIQSSAGLHILTEEGWHPTGEGLRARKTLLDLDPQETHVLRTDEELLLRSVYDAPGRLRVQLQLHDMPYLPVQPVSVAYALNDGEEQIIELTPDRTDAHLDIAMPQGEHALRFAIRSPHGGHYVGIRIVRRDNDTGDVTSLKQRRELVYQVATHGDPVRINLLGPVEVRIDEQRGDTVHSRTRFFPQGWQALVIYPEDDQPQALVRVYERRATPPGARRLRAAITLAPSAASLPKQDLAPAPSPTVAALTDAVSLGGQEDGTWSLAMRSVRSKPVDESSLGRSGANKYLETALGHYYFAPELQTYFETTALLRTHIKGGFSYGAWEKLHYQPTWLPVDLRLEWQGYRQDSPGSAWSSTWRAAIEQNRPINGMLAHRPSLAFFHRSLGQDAGFVSDPDRTDPDVYTDYKSRHPRGIVISDTLTYQPWRDTSLRARASLVSDEDGSFTTPEHLSVTFGAAQMFGDLSGRLDYRLNHYFAQDGHDWKRSRASDSQTLSGRILWDATRGERGRLQFQAEADYELESGDYGLSIGLVWFFDKGRGYRDYRPGTVDFRELRVYRDQLQNNRNTDARDGTP